MFIKIRISGRLLSLLLILSLFVAVQPFAYSQDPPTQTIESNDAQVVAAGTWSAQTAAEASGGSYVFNGGSVDDALTLEFYGTTLEVIYLSGPTLGTLAIEIDGTVLRTVITQATQTHYRQKSSINYLTDEWHTLRVYAQDGGLIAVDAFVVQLEAPMSTNDVAVPDNALEPRAYPGTPIINEVYVGQFAQIELYNPTNSVLNITGWRLTLYSGNSLEGIYVFPNGFTLYPGAYVVAQEGTGTNTATTVYLNISLSWQHGTGAGGAVALSNSAGNTLDFVRWGTSTIGGNLTGTPPNPDLPNSLSRRGHSDDSNNATDWISTCATLGGPNGRCLVINEVFYGISDYVELYNGSSQAVSLAGWRVEVYRANVLDINYTLPNINIAPNGYLVLREGAGTNTATTLYMTAETGLDASGGAVILRMGTPPVDFMRWGSSTIAPPAGTTFFGTASPTPAVAEGSFARAGAYGDDHNWMSDWCGQVGTAGAMNYACLLINEVDTGEPDSIEIYNASTTNWPMAGWQVDVLGSSTRELLYTFPAFTLNAGSYVRLIEGTGTSTPDHLYMNASINAWVENAGGLVGLYSPSAGQITDVVRWGNAAWNENQGMLFTGPPLPGAPPASSGRGFSRNSANIDRNLTYDWCIAPKTLYYPNYGCEAELALFLPASNFVSLIDSSITPPTAPAPNDYLSYATGVPATATNGQWVMGDWDGDGVDTPGVYATNGVFYHTNVLGPTANWISTWFGLTTGVAGNHVIAGRFYGGYTQNDCVGVVDSQNFPPFGTAFALYFTCELNGGNPTKAMQWLSVLLPDSGGFTGAYQFGAGDFDSNIVQSIAVRRGNYIAFSNTNPAIVNGEFPLAQYIGTPPGASGLSYFVVGDWDNSGVDSFGLFYPSIGRHYFRNDLLFNSGIYGYQDVGLPLGPSATVATWTGY